jgi:hypothetical protein
MVGTIFWTIQNEKIRLYSTNVSNTRVILNKSVEMSLHSLTSLGLSLDLVFRKRFLTDK